MNELTVQYSYTKQDVINFVLDTISFEKIRCTLFLIFNLTTLIIGIVFLFKHLFLLGVFFIAVSMLVFPLVLFLTYKLMERSICVITGVVCTLKDNGIDFITNLGDSLFEYKEIYDIKVTDELILVYISEKNAIVIPKRAFKTKEASYNFTAKLLEDFKNSKRLKL